ncbi:MAG: AAA family ATPase, partial [Oscillibacter sp.]|nr:AAA family ATPase [Oscillibacter sp.]
MEQIKSFTINRLTLSGFKCFETEQTFHFGDYTSIYGHNGKGKSSLADA